MGEGPEVGGSLAHAEKGKDGKDACGLGVVSEEWVLRLVLSYVWGSTCRLSARQCSSLLSREKPHLGSYKPSTGDL